MGDVLPNESPKHRRQDSRRTLSSRYSFEMDGESVGDLSLMRRRKRVLIFSRYWPRGPRVPTYGHGQHLRQSLILGGLGLPEVHRLSSIRNCLQLRQAQSILQPFMPRTIFDQYRLSMNEQKSFSPLYFPNHAFFLPLIMEPHIQV
jgi:hypothetical protein